MSQHKTQREEVRWRTSVNNVDIDTGEKITNIEGYKLIKIKKHTHVYKQTGRIELTKLYRRDTQGKLF